MGQDHVRESHAPEGSFADDRRIDYTRERSLGLPNKRVREEIEGDAVCGELPPGVSAETYHARAFAITEVARDGHMISLGDRTLEILHIPGHTPDAIALLERETGYLWTGDSFYEGPVCHYSLTYPTKVVSY